MGTIFIISENSQNNYKGENSASVLLTQKLSIKKLKITLVALIVEWHIQVTGVILLLIYKQENFL